MTTEKWYFYYKDKAGKEVCEEVDNVDEEIENQLFSDSSSGFLPEADSCVQTVFDGDFAGYKTINEYIANEGEDDWIKTIKGGIDNGLAFPLTLIRHVSGSYELSEDGAIDWRGLYAEYVDSGHYTIPPDFYSTSDITPEVAAKNKMWALAKALRGCVYVIYDNVEDNEEPDEYDTLEDAQQDVDKFNDLDRKDGTYKPERYEIIKKPC